MELPFRGGLSTWRGGKRGLCHQVRDRACTAVLKDRELGERIIQCYPSACLQEVSKPKLAMGCHSAQPITRALLMVTVVGHRPGAPPDPTGRVFRYP